MCADLVSAVATKVVRKFRSSPSLAWSGPQIHLGLGSALGSTAVSVAALTSFAVRAPSGCDAHPAISTTLTAIRSKSFKRVISMSTTAPTGRATSVKELKTNYSNVRKNVEAALEESGGLLRLAPCWVPRSFLQ